jgi:FkbM family methyltransferase
MRRIFIDLGAHIGESIRFFRDYHPESKHYEYFAFEPLPDNIERLHEINNLTIIPAAASIRDGHEKFFIGLPESGSLNNKKRSGGLDGERHIEVKTVNFPRWFNELISGDYVPDVTIKMNIEGAEYEIIEKMNRYGQIPFVRKWYIQWHYEKIDLVRGEHNRIKSMIPDHKLFKWEAMFGQSFVDYFKSTI